MKKSLLLLSLIFLAGCDHHKSADQAHAEASAAAVAQNDSALTGEVSSSKPSSSKAASPALSESEPAAGSASEPASPPPAPAPSSPPPPEPTSAPIAVTPPAVPAAPEKEEDQVVVLQTSLGRMVIELDDSAAPKTCENFRKLVSDGSYNHTVFHRVIPNFMIQGGDPHSKTDDRATYGQGGPGYTLPAEIKLNHDRGAVAMARLPDSVNPKRESNGSQFYICVAPCPSLNGQYTVFGHVIKGMNVADKIAEQPRDNRDNPLTRIEMEASLESKVKALTDSSTVNP